MGGWFKKEIKTVADLKGLKMRIPGIGGEVMGRLGAVPQALPGNEIYAALERGVIDAAEWVGPHDDEKLGLYKIAKHYYYPAFWEGGTGLCVMINAAAWEKLPKPYQEAVQSAAAEAHVNMQAQYDAKNPIALKSLLANGVKLRPFPRDLLRAAQKVAFELYEAEAAKNPAFRKLYDPWKKFREQQNEWFSVAELSFAALGQAGK
jgi:TRAP-type mannitol/chloroaromatic compound transport system substrate-binding protein